VWQPELHLNSRWRGLTQVVIVARVRERVIPLRLLIRDKRLVVGHTDPDLPWRQSARTAHRGERTDVGELARERRELIRG